MYVIMNDSRSVNHIQCVHSGLRRCPTKRHFRGTRQKLEHEHFEWLGSERKGVDQSPFLDIFRCVGSITVYPWQCGTTPAAHTPA